MAVISIIAAACVAYVHDGDTLNLCSGETVRIASIDAPEIAGSPRCSQGARRRLSDSANPPWCDFELGAKSTHALRALIASGDLRVERFGTDRFGRTLARLTVNGIDIGAELVDLGYAKRWR